MTRLGLTKNGTGTLLLTGANTYTGATNVNAGTLALAASQSNVGPVNVADYATLRVSSLGVAANRPTLVTSSLGLGNGDTTTLALDFGSEDVVTPLISTGTLTLGGAVNLSLLNGGALTTGSHLILAHTAVAGDGTFSPTAFTLGPRSTGTLRDAVTSGGLVLDVVADRPVWTGGDNGTWAAGLNGANKNWVLQTAATPTDYLEGDSVLFDDTATGPTAVVLGSNVTPSAVTFNNSAKNYSLSGGYGIGGAASLTKSGTGTLTIGTANSYTGGTTVSGGRLIAANAAALGTGGLRLNGAAFGSATSVTVGGPLFVTGTNVIGYAGQNGNITINGGLSGNGTLTNFVGSAADYNVFFNGDASGFTGTINYTSNNAQATGWWRFGATNTGVNLTNATLVLNKGNVTSPGTAANKNVGFTDGITGAALNVGALSGDGVFQASYNNSGPNTLAVGFLNTNTTFSGVIAGGNAGTNLNFTKVGTGTLTLTGVNLYTGVTTISGGTVVANSNASLGGDSAALVLNGGALTTVSTNVLNNTHVTTIGSAGGTLNLLGSGSASPGQGARMIINATNGLTGSGPLTVNGAGTLAGATPNATVDGAGVLVLNGSNNYAGTLTLANGAVLESAGNGALGSATVNLRNESELSVTNGTTVGNTVLVNGSTNATLSFTNSAGTQSGAVNLGGSTLTVALRNWYNYAAAQNGTISGVVSGTGGVSVNSGTSATPATLSLGGANTFTGNLTINNAVVAATLGINDFNTNGRSNGALGNEQTAGRQVIVNSGGTLSLSAGNVLGSGGSSIAQAPNLTVVVNAGGTLVTNAPDVGGAGGGDANILGNLVLNGGTLTAGKGYDANFQAVILLKSVTVGGTTASTINTNTSNTIGNGVMLGDAANGTDAITFTVADATNSPADDLIVSARLANSANAAANPAAIGALVKDGPGTLRLSGANTYTGSTTIKAGTLRATSAAYAGLLGNAGGVDLQGSGVLVLDYTASSPVGQVKSILAAGYAGKFAAGQVRSTTLAAGRTLGYGDNGSSVTVRVTLPGDADLDGDVDFNDFLALQNNFGQTGTRFDQGNFDYNNTTDFNDFLALQNNFGKTVVGGNALGVTAAERERVMSITSAAAVPEPAALALIGLSAGGLLRRRRMGRRVGV